MSHLTIDGDVSVNFIVYEMLGQNQSMPPPTSSTTPYPAAAGSIGMPPYPPQSSGYSPINPQYHPQQPYPSSSQPYPTQNPNQSFIPPPNVYPSGSGAYNTYAQPPGYKPHKKNKGLGLGTGILGTAGESNHFFF